MSADYQLGRCPICNSLIADKNEHIRGTEHKFNYIKFQYNKDRKALLQDRHGVELLIKPDGIENNQRFHYEYMRSRGKYAISITPTNLSEYQNKLLYRCKIKNNLHTSIYLTAVDLMHPCDYFEISHDFNNNAIFELRPGTFYKFSVLFKINTTICASYKIPLFCSFQTTDEENQLSFTIVRTFLVTVDDHSGVVSTKMKSPFTSQMWSGVQKIIAPLSEQKTINEYQVPENYKKLLKYGLLRHPIFTQEEMGLLFELLDVLCNISTENYNKYWHILLWLEEHAQSFLLTKYNMEFVTMQAAPGSMLLLKIPGLAEKRPSVIPGDLINIRLHEDHTIYQGTVRSSDPENEMIDICDVDPELVEMIKQYPDTELDVSFNLSRLCFERMHRAVDAIYNTGMVENLFPKVEPTYHTLPIYEINNTDFLNKTILCNEEQKNAVVKILNHVQKEPYIVFGPPGTGKTVTIVEAIVQIKNKTKKQILVCAPANAACDNIAMRLIPYCKKKDLLRIHADTRERSSWEHLDKLKQFSNLDKDGEIIKIDLAQLQSHRIIVTTLNLIGRYVRHNYHPQCIFIDEAAQASEPECDIAISLVNIGKLIVLAGDPKQLGPMATDRADQLGYGKSLLERLMEFDIYKPDGETNEYNSVYITMLKQNFRSHSSILKISNILFYDNMLLSMSKVVAKDPLVRMALFPLIDKTYKGPKDIVEAIEFCSVASKERKEGSSPSYFNLNEAKMVVQYVKILLNLTLKSEHKVTMDQIGVVTPYKRQVHKIKEFLKHARFDKVEVGTTEAFQGREKRVMIISTVRAHHSLLRVDKKFKLGFVDNHKRFNVAITRAQSKLIVIGCPLLLRTDDKWRLLIETCEQNQSFFGAKQEHVDDRFRNNVVKRMEKFKSKDDQYNKNKNGA